jgi:copper chaperone CopZ
MAIGLVGAGALGVWMASSSMHADRQLRNGTAGVQPAALHAHYAIAGMHCDGCAEAIVAEVMEVPGVQAIECSYATQTADVTMSSEAQRADVERAITKLGYKIQPRDPDGAADESGAGGAEADASKAVPAEADPASSK